ncbi:hypothetical protein QA600_18515 [Natronococcus sp. A-GB1]|uniref:hypothetical protein n=1 Tax=Natronococcus sp. A-GB1 TaxID=3037648 RepID=UPI00241DF956|nr:hypothetical protein [Natronococcus sp. A-GB1]MDG5761327.1 hypothetical protein [Natronococcus sp. A-GB1]
MGEKPSDDGGLPMPETDRGQPPKQTRPVTDPDMKTVQVKGRRVQLSQEMTVRDLKDRVDVSEDNLAYLRSGDELKALNDDDRPYQHVDDGDRLTFRPGAKKNPFG